MTDLSTVQNYAEVWQKAKSELANSLPQDTFDSWFSSIEFESADEYTMRLSVNGELAAIWIHDNYMDILTSHVSMAAGSTMSVKLESREESPVLRQEVIHCERIQEEVPQVKAELPKSINPRNTFENFVVGESNRYAHAAALAVAQNPGVAFNPLLIYGSTGLGKTHLMHAIAHFLLHSKPNAKIAYVSSEAFVNEYVNALRDNKLVNFRRHYRNMDVLLIDDVQFFAGKERIQEEFFHTFNELKHSGKQIVLTCDKALSEVPDIEPRLVSRIEWGLSVDIQSPDYETRLAILRKKMQEKGSSVRIAPEAMDFIARKFTNNVRRLEGALNNIIGYALLVNARDTDGQPQEISLEKAQQILASSIVTEDDSEILDVEFIQKKIAAHYKIGVDDVIGKRRTQQIASARQIAMYFSRELTKNTLQEIGAKFGGRDHSTVLHAIEVVKNEIEQNEKMRDKMAFLKKILTKQD